MEYTIKITVGENGNIERIVGKPDNSELEVELNEEFRTSNGRKTRLGFLFVYSLIKIINYELSEPEL